MIRRKPLDEDDDNPDRWLVSYADFITLLFAFFVVMYAISSVNQGKYAQLTNSMGTAFSGDGASGVNQDSTKKGLGTNGKPILQQKTVVKPLPLTYLYQERIRREKENMATMSNDISAKLAPLIQQEKVRVIQNNRGIRIDINDSLLFNQGSAELSFAAGGIIGEIANMIKDKERPIQVEGHTDNIPIHNQQFFSNWELSAVRASSVVRMLSTHGIADKRLSALGFGASQPVTENATPAGRARNRRVSIVVLYENTQDTNSNVMLPQ